MKKTICNSNDCVLVNCIAKIQKLAYELDRELRLINCRLSDPDEEENHEGECGIDDRGLWCNED